MIYKEAKTQFDIISVIKKRWSPRAFDINKKVSREIIYTLCEAARWAPSSFNEQPWRFMIFDKFHNEEQYNKAFKCLVEWNQKWVRTAPVLVAILSDSLSSKNGKINKYHNSDAAAAAYGFCLQATAMGIKTHQMGGFSAEKIQTEFNIPERYKPLSMMAVGYQAEIDVIPESYHKDEKAERERHPIGFNFYDSMWEKPIIDILA